MGLTFSLVMMAFTGVAILFVPGDAIRLTYEGAPGLLRVWYGSVSAFAVPLCLAVLRFTKSTAILFGGALWAAWLLVVSMVLLVRSSLMLPSAPYNTLVVAFVIVFSLATLVFSYFEWNKRRASSVAVPEKKSEHQPPKT